MMKTVRHEGKVNNLNGEHDRDMKSTIETEINLYLMSVFYTAAELYN